MTTLHRRWNSAAAQCAAAVVIFGLSTFTGCQSDGQPSKAITSQKTIPVKPLSKSAPPSAKRKGEEATPRTKTSNIELGKVLRTDSPAIAIGNLDSAIKLKTNQFQTDQIRKTALWELVHHHLTRARYLGRTDSFKQAESIAAAAYKKDVRAETLELVADVDIAMHRFDLAEQKIKTAQSLKGADKNRLSRSMASIELARGKNTSRIVSARRERALQADSWKSWSRAAIALSENGQYTEADQAFEKALSRYRGTSPFIIAWMYFARGVMWAESAGDSAKGRALYERAVKHLPQYLVASIHLAEMEAEAGETKAAIRRLEALVESDSDPELFAKLSEFHGANGDKEKANSYLQDARKRYAALLATYPAAWADHGTEFYLGPGADPKRALELAQLNRQTRATPRARALIIEAALAAGQNNIACQALEDARAISFEHIKLSEAKHAAMKVCP